MVIFLSCPLQSFPHSLAFNNLCLKKAKNDLGDQVRLDKCPQKSRPFETGANFMQHQNTIVKIPQFRAKAAQPVNAPFMKCAVTVQREGLFICAEFSFIKVTHGWKYAITRWIYKRLEMNKGFGQEESPQALAHHQTALFKEKGKTPPSASIKGKLGWKC